MYVFGVIMKKNLLLNDGFVGLEKPKRKVTIGKNGSLIINIKNDKFKKKRSHTDYIKKYMVRIRCY